MSKKKTESEQTIQKETENTMENEQVEVQESNDPKDLKISELTNTLQRLQAEFENYKKRVDKENVSTIKNANASLIKELLAVLDSFELALKNNHNDNPEISKFRKGLELIYAQLYSLLESHGVRIIDTKDKQFDPFKHEVLMVKECDERDDKILQEFQKGYMLHDNVLRHSKVMIAKHVSVENKTDQ